MTIFCRYSLARIRVAIKIFCIKKFTRVLKKKSTLNNLTLTGGRFID